MDVKNMPDCNRDDIDCSIISLAVHAFDLAECDLDVPEHTEQLRTTVLAILHALDDRERLKVAQPISVRA